MSNKYNSKKKGLLGSYIKTNFEGTQKGKLKYSNVDDKWLENEETKTQRERNQDLLKFAYLGDKRRVKIALTYDNAANINSTDKNGNNALILSVYSRGEEVVKYLANYHKDEKGWEIPGIDAIDLDHVNQDCVSALHLSSKLKNRKISKILLAAGANPNVLGKFGETPIFESVKEADPDGIEILYSFGADLNHRNREGFTPAIVACQNKFRQEALLKLKKLGADLRIRDKAGRTTLMHAANNDNGAIMDILLKECGEKEFINASDKNGVTTLMICAKRGNREATRVLLARGANPFALDNKGLDAMDYAYRYENYTCAEIIAKAQRIYLQAQERFQTPDQKANYLSAQLEAIGKQNRIQNSCCK